MGISRLVEVRLVDAAQNAYTPRSGPHAAEESADAMARLAHETKSGAVSPQQARLIIKRARAAGMQAAIEGGIRIPRRRS